MKLSTAILHSSFLILHFSLSAAVPLRWQVETSRVQPVVFDAVRGETLALEAAFKSYGTPLQLATNATYNLFYQTNGMGTAWWQIPAAVSLTNRVSAIFAPTNDPGASSLLGFLGSTGDIYRAVFTLRFRNGPGATPNAIAAPVPILDLASTTVVNPPWPSTNDFITATNRMEATLKTYVDEQITGAGTVSPQIATNISEEVVTSKVTKAYVDALGVSGMTDNALVYTNSVIKTQDGSHTVTASDVGALATYYNSKYIAWDNIGLHVNSTLFCNSFEAGNVLAAYSLDVGEATLTGGNSGTIAVTGDITDALTPVRSSVTSNRTSLATLSTQFSTIGAHLNAEDARFVSTNYNSSTHLPEASVEIKMTDSATSSNYWYRIWSEMTRWNAFTGTNFTWTGWNGFYAFSTNIAAEVSAASPREYAFFDGVTGEAAPDGFFWISQPHVAVCAGAGYQRYVDGASEVWVLESNGLVADINGTTNGYFRITDSEGNAQFEIIKGDKQTVFANANALTRTNVNGVTHWSTTYSVTNAVSAPTAYFASSLTNATWYADDDADCPCNVSWTSGSDSYTLEWWPKSTMPSMFVKASYERGGLSYINNSAPVKMQTIIIGNKKYSLGTTTVSGETVLKLTEVN